MQVKIDARTKKCSGVKASQYDAERRCCDLIKSSKSFAFLQELVRSERNYRNAAIISNTYCQSGGAPPIALMPVSAMGAEPEAAL